MFDVTVSDTRGGQRQAKVDKNPDACPICHRGIEPKAWGLGYDAAGSPFAIERCFVCPRETCQHLFIARYTRPPAGGAYFVRDVVPLELLDKTYSEVVLKVSQDFCAIDAQADKAERLGFLLVAGPGYRKALEFLVKDYLCGLLPGTKEEIEKAPLAQCIAKFVKNENVKLTASRAAWLGNDETHFIRKWEDKDLQDLKGLIKLTMLWIEMEELTKNVAADMPEGKK